MVACQDLSTDSFLQALDRFIAIRGKPAELISDNGTNFVGAINDKELVKSLWGDSKIGENLVKNGIKLTFIPAHSQWYNRAECGKKQLREA